MGDRIRLPILVEPVSTERFRMLEVYEEGELEVLSQPQQTLEEHLIRLEQERVAADSNLETKERELARRHAEIEALNRQLGDYRTRLDETSDRLEFISVRAHLRALRNFWPGLPEDKIDEAVVRLVTHPDFIEIYRNTLVIRDPLRRHEYLLMRALQLGLLDVFVDYRFFDRLAPLGLNIVCPYLRVVPDKDGVYDQCMIDGGEGINALCRGRYDKCVIFDDRTRRFATGELQYVASPKTYKAPELTMSEDERENLERQFLRQIEAYWRDD